MRLFAALVPPAGVLDELAAYLTPHQTVWPDLRWVRPDTWHITLAFYGELDERGLERLLPRLERAAGRYPPLELSFAGGGAFPSGGAHARVLWTGLYGDRRELARLAASTLAAGRRAGAPLARHAGFKPHLTLARCSKPTDVRRLVEQLSTFAGSPWTAGSLHLVRSHIGSTVRYEPLETWSLKG